MKKIIKIFAFLLPMFVCMACKPDPVSDPYLNVSPSVVPFRCDKDLVQKVTISTEDDWTISNVPSWLSVPTSGHGITTIELVTLSKNDTDKQRCDTLVVKTASITMQLVVKQEPNRVVCYVQPTNLVALWDQIAFDLQAVGDINIFKYQFYSQAQINRFTDRELEEDLEKTEELKYQDDYLFFPNSYVSGGMRYGFLPNTTYYICTIAYDKDGNKGKVRQTPITTRPFLDYDSDAYVSFSDQAYGAGGFTFTCTKEALCHTYHVIYGNLPVKYKSYNPVAYAFEINYYIQHHQLHWFAKNWNMKIITNYENNHAFIYETTSLPTYPLISAWAWGVFKDGTLSSDLMGYYWDTSQTASSSIKTIGHRNHKHTFVEPPSYTVPSMEQKKQ